MRRALLILVVLLLARTAAAQNNGLDLPAATGFNIETLRQAARVCEAHAVCPSGTVIPEGREVITRQNCAREPQAWDEQLYTDTCPGVLQRWRDAEARSLAVPPPIPSSPLADKQILENATK